MVSTNKKIMLVEGLLGTNDLNDWESTFITDIGELTHHGKDVSEMTDNRLAVLDRIYKKHFAG